MADYWTPKDYTPDFLINKQTHTPSEIRKEYTRLRDITVKRAARLEKAGLKREAQYLRTFAPKLSEIKEERQVSMFLSYMKSNIDTRTYSLKGLRELQKYFSEETGEPIKLGDVLPFADYMKSWRLSAYSNTLVMSDMAVKLYPEEYQDVGGNFADFYTLYKKGI